MDMNWIRKHVQQYLDTDGKEGGEIHGMPVLLFTAKGRKSGKDRTVPLVFVRDGDNIVIAASKGGAPTHPTWFLNLSADPAVKVQVLADKFSAKAVITEGDERDRLWGKLVEAGPFFAEYAAGTDRLIPVVVLERQ